MPLVEYCRKPHDKDEGHQKNHWVEILGIGFHIGPFVPAAGEIDDDGDHEQEPDGDPDKELPDDFLLPGPVSFPILDKILFLVCQHGQTLIYKGKQAWAESTPQTQDYLSFP